MLQLLVSTSLTTTPYDSLSTNNELDFNHTGPDDKTKLRQKTWLILRIQISVSQSPLFDPKSENWQIKDFWEVHYSKADTIRFEPVGL